MDDLDTFDGWRKHHRYDVEGATKDQVNSWRDEFEHAKARRVAARSAVFFNQPVPQGEYRYAVAIEDGVDLRLALAVSRRPKKRGYECVILKQREGDWNPHATYHQDGTYHQKSFGHKWIVEKRQPLDRFKGTEHLYSFLGFGTGAAPICDPANFTAVLTVPQGILESTSGIVLIDCGMSMFLVNELVVDDKSRRQMTKSELNARVTYSRFWK